MGLYLPIMKYNTAWHQSTPHFQFRKQWGIVNSTTIFTSNQKVFKTWRTIIIWWTQGMSEGRINHSNSQSKQLKSDVKKQTLI